MIKHYIIMSSSYSDGKRIALDITDEKLLNSQSIGKIIEDIRANCDQDVPLSAHYIQTESLSWESVLRYDPFFEDVECVETVDEFTEKVKKDRKLSGLDVANYIAANVLCTHLKLEKLVYMAYADYLCESGKKLFDDKIYAFTYGPVIESVYETYKRSGIETVYPKDISGEYIISEKMPFRSRILFAKDGVKKIRSIDRTLKKYSKLSAFELVDLTHKAGTPWNRVNSSYPYSEISDFLIKEFHYIEN